MDFAGIVPGDTPFKNLTADPPPGVGPYKITSSVPNRGFTMVKNDQFPGLNIPDIPTGYLDEIDVKIVKNQQRQIDDVLQNKVDFLQDPPPADRMREVADKAKGRFEPYVTNSTYYVFLNERVAPFDNEKVRQAVNYGIDKRALARIFGGLLAPACNFLPPGMKGLPEGRAVPVRRPERGAERGEGQAAHQGGGRRGR